jgi:hypothetical protein
MTLLYFFSMMNGSGYKKLILKLRLVKIVGALFVGNINQTFLVTHQPEKMCNFFFLLNNTFLALKKVKLWHTFIQCINERHTV